MPTCQCNNCGNLYNWKWEEAFCKFGFNDGDGQIETWQVASILYQAGYKIDADQRGLHNTIIVSIKKEGQELMPYHDPEFSLGYDDPRHFLPKEIVDLLDEKLPEI